MNEQALLTLVLEETGKIADCDTPMDALVADSLEFMNLILRVETLCDVKISDAAIIRINKVGDLLTEARAARILQG